MNQGGVELSVPDGRISRIRVFLSDRIYMRTIVASAILISVLLYAIHIETRARYINIDIWLAGVVFLALSMVKLRTRSEFLLSTRLMQLVGYCSTAYLVLRYPLLPVAPDNPAAQSAYSQLMIVWASAAIAGVAAFRYPSLAVLPAGAIRWIDLTAERVTGLPYHGGLDTTPLTAIALFLGTGLWIWSAFRFLRPRLPMVLEFDEVLAERWYSKTLLTFAICIHLSNYFWAFIEKMALDGPILSWLTWNNSVWISAVAFDEGHLTFDGYNFAVIPLMYVLKNGYIANNLFVLLAQATAIIGIMLPRRGLFILLIAFDIMHFAIFIAAGANFWTWIALNICIASIVVHKEYKSPAWPIALASILFIYYEPGARLGWYDSGANNTVSYEAEDENGTRYYLSTNFFGFYSYPIAHIAYGLPDAQNAFAVGVNGGTKDYSVAKSARECDINGLKNKGHIPDVDPRLDTFIRNYFAMIRGIEHPIPYNFYPHHFYVKPSRGAAFDSIDPANVVAVVMKRESVCVGLQGYMPVRRVIASAEHRIPLRQ